MANLLYPDESQRNEFLKSYAQVQMLRQINTDSVLGTIPIMGALGGSVLNGQYALARGQLAQIMSTTGKPEDVKANMNQIDSIQWMNVPIQEKRAFLAQILQKNLNINVSQVHQLGLDQGTVLSSLPDSYAS